MDAGLTFDEARDAIKPQTVFTTHTPIIQGNESHAIDRLMYMGANNGLTIEQMVEIGGAPFNMTVAALKTCKIANAVAQLHTKTAKKDVEAYRGRMRNSGYHKCYSPAYMGGQQCN